MEAWELSTEADPERLAEADCAAVKSAFNDLAQRVAGCSSNFSRMELSVHGAGGDFLLNPSRPTKRTNCGLKGSSSRHPVAKTAALAMTKMPKTMRNVVTV